MCAVILRHSCWGTLKNVCHAGRQKLSRLYTISPYLNLICWWIYSIWFYDQDFCAYYSDCRWGTASHLTVCCHYSIWVYTHSWGCWMDSQLMLFLSPIPSASSFPLAISCVYPPSQYFFLSFRLWQRFRRTSFALQSSRIGTWSLFNLFNIFVSILKI